MLNPNAQKLLGDLAEAPPHLLWVEKKRKGKNSRASECALRTPPPPSPLDPLLKTFKSKLIQKKKYYFFSCVLFYTFSKISEKSGKSIAILQVVIIDSCF